MVTPDVATGLAAPVFVGDPLFVVPSELVLLPCSDPELGVEETDGAPEGRVNCEGSPVF